MRNHTFMYPLHAPTDEQNDFFSITVSNDGLPIPVEMKEKIFEPFVQIKNVIQRTNQNWNRYRTSISPFTDGTAQRKTISKR